MTIRELKRVPLTPRVIDRINDLLGQLSRSGAKTNMFLMRRVAKDRNVFCFLMMGKNTIIGMGSLLTFFTPRGKESRIENVVVDNAYRGKGLGKVMTERLITEAKRQKIRFIELSSSPDRVAANAMYQKLGFQKRETNVYRLMLS